MKDLHHQIREGRIRYTDTLWLRMYTDHYLTRKVKDEVCGILSPLAFFGHACVLAVKAETKNKAFK